MQYVKTKKGYYYRINNSGKKTRISQDVYSKNIKKNYQKGGTKACRLKIKSQEPILIPANVKKKSPLLLQMTNNNGTGINENNGTGINENNGNFERILVEIPETPNSLNDINEDEMPEIIHLIIDYYNNRNNFNQALLSGNSVSDNLMAKVIRLSDFLNFFDIVDYFRGMFLRRTGPTASARNVRKVLDLIYKKTLYNFYDDIIMIIVRNNQVKKIC